MFDDIRPYYDSEIPSAMRRIASKALFTALASFVFPDRDVEQVRREIEGITTSEQFQRKVMYKANERIIQESMTEFTYSGIENIEKGKPYLFVSNHRDIMLDASLLQNLLLDNDMPTTQITFGANLMQDELVVDIGKSNKMFRVSRPGGSIREFYKASMHLSDYIRNAILVKKDSVWIAQRNGRTKDGVDRTDQGIIKMFEMSRSDDKLKSIVELNIVPVAVSYEWEPCDILKTTEVYARSKGPYQKKPGEDLNSVLIGINQPKGRVHFHICEPLKEDELAPLARLSANEYHKRVASLLDKRICSAYRLMPNNFIAHDMLSGADTYAGEYTPRQKELFIKSMERLEKSPEEYDREELRRIYLSIYASPVDSRNIFV